MANPTTNYGFVLPTSSDLVTDLPADFDVALQGVDTRLKALQPGTTLGDLAYSSATANTNTRLGVGTTGQVLTVAGGVPSWATPTSGSMTQLATGSLTGSSVVVSSLSGSYRNLKVIITGFKAGGNSLALRINNDSTASRHVTTAFGVFPSAVTFGATFISITDGGNSSSDNALAVIDINEYANTTTRKFVQFYSIVAANADAANAKISGANGAYNQTDAITGLTFLPDSGTFAGGTYFIYGVK